MSRASNKKIKRVICAQASKYPKSILSGKKISFFDYEGDGVFIRRSCGSIVAYCRPISITANQMEGDA